MPFRVDIFFNNLFLKLALVCTAVITESMGRILLYLPVADICFPSRERQRKVLVPGSQCPGSWVRLASAFLEPLSRVGCRGPHPLTLSLLLVPLPRRRRR